MSKLDSGLLFRDLTQLGLPKSQFSFISSENAYKYNPDRYNFYIHLLDNVSDPNQKIASKVFGILARGRRQHERIQEKVDHLSSAINYLKAVYTKPDNIEEGPNMKNIEVLKDDLNNELLRKPIVNTEYEFEELEKPEVKGGGEQVDVIRKIGGSYFSERLNELNKIAEKQKDKNKRETMEDDVSLEYKYNPLYSPELEKATFTDRLVFIVMTFILRAIAMTFINSAIQSQYITTFVQAFGYYFVIYTILFLIWVLIVNMRKEDYIAGLMFYYVNANYNKQVWTSRIGLHILIQAFVLPLPIMLTPKYGSKSETDTFEKREGLTETLGFFTAIIWVITSVVALRA